MVKNYNLSANQNACNLATCCTLLHVVVNFISKWTTVVWEKFTVGYFHVQVVCGKTLGSQRKL